MSAELISPPAKEITYDQYIAELDSSSPTMQPYEILDGALKMVYSPNWRHQRITLKIGRLLDDYAAATGTGFCGIAPFDVVIRRVPKLRTRQPDIFFITKERLEQNREVLESGPLHVAPELVVEVLSPSETPRSLRGKIDDFRSIGSKECWVVSPDAETVQVLKLTEDSIESVGTYAFGEKVQSAAFPDLTVATEDIFME